MLVTGKARIFIDNEKNIVRREIAVFCGRCSHIMNFHNFLEYSFCPYCGSPITEDNKMKVVKILNKEEI